jgi:recombination protein RecA
LIVRSGAWFRYGELHIGQGREKARQYLIDNKKVAEELRNKVMVSGVDTVSVAAGGESSNGDAASGSDEEE